MSKATIVTGPAPRTLKGLLPSLDVATVLVHADDEVEKSPDLAPPIHVATTFREDNAEGLVYSRFEQKTRSRVEVVLGQLEGGKALVYSSGLSAVLAALMFYKPKCIYIKGGYVGTHSVLQAYLSQFHGDEKEAWYSRIKKLDKETVNNVAASDLLWLETPKNPTCELEDIKFFSAAAEKVGAHVVVDSTFATPILQKPLALGAHMVMHSSTKFLAGHSDVLGGVLVVREDNVWAKLLSQRVATGMIMGNLENFLLLRSLRTLQLRVLKQSKNATAVAAFLAQQSKVVKVYHPSLPSHPQHQLCLDQMSGFPPILSFELKSAEAAKTLNSKLILITPATSLGGVHSTIDWRYKFDSTLSPGLLRLSIGIESKKDLINDLKSALEFIGNE